MAGVPISAGRLQVATPATMAAAVNQPTEARDAVDNRVRPIAAGIIATDETVKLAAANAVTSDIAGRDLVEGSDRRVVTADDPASHVVTDEHGNMSFANLEDGRTFIADPVFGRPISGGAPEILRVIFIILLGQSNAEGRGIPYSSRLDRMHSRSYMWSWADQALRPATVPLSSQQQQVGLSIGTVIMKEHLATVDESTAVVVLNAAAGGSGLVAEPPQGSWKIDYAGPNPHLYPIAIDAIDDTIAAMEAQFPSAVIEPWIYWHQGEADGLVSYGTRLDQLMNAVRTHLGDPTIPWTSGGLVPENMSGGHFTVRTALLGSQTRNQYCAYTDGIPNGGGSQNVTDAVHYGREGVERLGKRMFEASRRAATATDASVPHKPLDVQATFIGGTLRASWSEPITRYTNFVVEYRIDGGSWVTATRSIPEDIQQTVTGLTGMIAEVRVSTVNAALTSQPTIPVTALGV